MDELLREATGNHDRARRRITELVAELHHEQAELRDAYISAQRILATAGLNYIHLRDVPPLKTIVSEGGAVDELLHPDDITAAAA